MRRIEIRDSDEIVRKMGMRAVNEGKGERRDSWGREGDWPSKITREQLAETKFAKEISTKRERKHKNRNIEGKKKMNDLTQNPRKMG